jgi:hypothetical protein
MALLQLYASCLLYRLVSVWCSSGVSSVAFLLLGGASVAALASDWTERHRSRIASSCCPIPPTRGRVLSGARLSVIRWSGACQLCACVCG